jgi:hypothetical protein
MSLPVWKCEVCSKKFSVNEWVCQDGQSNHVIERKEYLLNDAPSDAGHIAPGSTINVTLREGRTRICNIPPPIKVMHGDNVQWIGEGYVEFVQGRYATMDPQIQYWLDKRGGYCTQEQWERAWLTDAQQISLERGRIDALKNRLEVERNDLLSQQKQRVGAA